MTETQDFAEIAEVVETYIDGMCRNDPEKLRRAMHEKMACIGHYNGGLEWATRDDFIKTVSRAVKAPDPSPWRRINAMSVAGDVATVQLEDIWLGDHYDDTLTLLRHDGRWVIVAKVFHLRPAG